MKHLVYQPRRHPFRSGVNCRTVPEQWQEDIRQQTNLLTSTVSEYVVGLQITTIKKIVQTRFILADGVLEAKCRIAKIAWARQIAIYLCEKLTDATQVIISAHFGDREHACVCNSRKAVTDRISIYPADAATVKTLEAACRAALSTEASREGAKSTKEGPHHE